jgi:maltose alpha-D-glucosyltransferase/alpha-amylase
LVALQRDPLWFKTAVFYELYVRSFYDANADGYGDFRGMIEKLDYLEWLGVDCIWLLPFYHSPLRDGGYDISDFYSILPEYGNLNDFMEFLDAAHERGLRVVADMVMNHTSDQHPWFQEARQLGSDKRDWYVWAPDDKGYPEARVIFVDT